MRWNDVIGRFSQAPNRVRGSAVGAAVAFAAVGASAAASGVPSVGWSSLLPRRNSRASLLFTLRYRDATRTAAANASPRSA
jgi:hypothetical protein